MPEGHTLHLLARLHQRRYAGAPVAVSSPQGRFADSAAVVDGRVLQRTSAWGKHLFHHYSGGPIVHVHLGLYGAFTEWERPGDGLLPEATGQVRMRMVGADYGTDLRGPTACVLQTPEEMLATVAKLGPDPLVGDPAENEERFVRVVRKKQTVIALLLMDQAVVSGIGNVYRAELLFRARQNPFTPGREVREEVVRALWRDWVHLLGIGYETGLMYTMDDEAGGGVPEHWVYKRTGEPCLVCGTEIAMQELGGRKLYWCPVDQA